MAMMVWVPAPANHDATVLPAQPAMRRLRRPSDGSTIGDRVSALGNGMEPASDRSLGNVATATVSAATMKAASAATSPARSPMRALP
jgi:hypothetical protein